VDKDAARQASSPAAQEPDPISGRWWLIEVGQ
jgi:hypothetical protein